MPPKALQALLSGAIDYAGLFPPAKLPMADAVREFARERASGHAWMLGRFVVPVDKLGEVEATTTGLLPRGVEASPWPLSVIAGDDPSADRERIDTFNDDHYVDAAANGRASILSVEARATDIAQVATLATAFNGIGLFVEIDHRVDPKPLLEAIAEHGVKAKIRTGGITGDAFPTPAQLARFLTAAHAAGVAWKATAGLHHAVRGDYPLTYESDSATGTMFGFLNVFLAAALTHAGALKSKKKITELLTESDHAAFEIDDEAISWRGHGVSRDAIAAARKATATSYGSCSFTQPVAGLERAGLL